MGKRKSIGLPGGPNEYITHVSQVFSTDGYKKNSPDVNNPFNIIESGSITMEDVEFPVLGTDNLGNTQMMQPGMTYEFPGNMVFETPMVKSGGSVSWKWKGKSYSGTLIPSMETSKARYARTKNGKIKTLPKAQKGLNWVRPYAKKGVKYLQDLFQSTNDFKSQIDWGKWNKAIPENQKLLQEYNLIEETTKANKTWMKNADGSAFTGTPEQFVQMKSGNFQKAFGNSKVQDIVMHKTDEVFDAFNPKKIGMSKDDGFYGRGFYFHPKEISKRYDDFYGKISMPSYINIVNPYTGKQTMEVGKQFAKDIDGRIIMGNYPGSNQQGLIPVEYVSTNPNNIKSAIGNDGMFDLTNPNIYKQEGGAQVRQYDPPGFFENLADILANPMTSFGYSTRNQRIPEGLNVNNPDRNAFDSVIDIINPFSWAQYAENSDKNLEKGEYVDAGFDALGAIPIIPAWLSKGKNFKGPITAAIKKVKDGIKWNKKVKDVVKPGDDMVEVFTSDGSKKLMKKTDAIRLNRIEDANVNNKTFVNYEDGNWFSNEITPFYLNNAKNSLKPGMLNPNDPKRLFSVYLDPTDARQFNVSKGVATERAANMSGGIGNIPINTEYVLPPSMVQKMRANQVGSGYNTMIGNSENIMKNLTDFYKRLGGSFQDGQTENLGGKLRIYKDYVNGVYDKSPSIDYVEKVYDKLNRVYLSQAKQANMSTPNYIMSYLVDE